MVRRGPRHQEAHRGHMPGEVNGGHASRGLRLGLRASMGLSQGRSTGVGCSRRPKEHLQDRLSAPTSHRAPAAAC